MRIAHISDLHLRHHLPGTAYHADRLSRAMPEYFARALTQIGEHAPDCLVVSGDLLDYPFDDLGKPVNDPETQAQGLQDLALIADLLTTLPVPALLVHGNHDHPALFDQVFGHIPWQQEVGDYQLIAFRDDEGPGNVPVRQGEMQRRFQAALDDLDSPPQVHIQHYMVWPERNEEYPHTYGAGAAMREAILATGHVRLVLSGHYHRGVPLFADKSSYFATVRGFTTSPHPFAIYDLHDDGSVTEQAYTLAL